MAEVPNNMYFSAPEQMTQRERARDTLITAILWAVYLYLWVPLVSLLAWALGFEFAYEVMVRAGGATDLLPILLEYAVVVSIIFSAFTIWSVSNRLRFKDLDRRTRREPVGDAALAAYFRIPQSQIAAMRSRQVIHVSIDDDGRPRISGLGRGGIYDEERFDPGDEDGDDDLSSSPPFRDASVGM
ncbi:MAG TPA: poly-beta-1,6-N-acetyl-D-glucosamine biosynthesis protein PgaD [Gammaproteobacteria bacterium]|jgi:biofilm PGA synthesis protein PgaD|nr:poly-beta-1,6-N-acetyl-D-glucosamine biosynthesis protein PgaD [Gammaproteobacteria bacterium]